MRGMKLKVAVYYTSGIHNHLLIQQVDFLFKYEKQSSCKINGFTLYFRNSFSFYCSKICALAKKYKSLTFLDECHATGFFGATGRYVDIQGTIIRA